MQGIVNRCQLLVDLGASPEAVRIADRLNRSCFGDGKPLCLGCGACPDYCICGVDFGDYRHETTRPSTPATTPFAEAASDDYCEVCACEPCECSDNVNQPPAADARCICGERYDDHIMSGGPCALASCRCHGFTPAS